MRYTTNRLQKLARRRALGSSGEVDLVINDSTIRSQDGTPHHAQKYGPKLRPPGTHLINLDRSCITESPSEIEDLDEVQHHYESRSDATITFRDYTKRRHQR